MLESVSLSRNTQVTDKVLKVLTELKRLHNLRIRKCREITSSGLSSFLDSIAHYQRDLTKFTFWKSDEQHVTDAFFDSLAKVQTITTLEFAALRIHGAALGRAIEKLIALENIVFTDVDIIGITKAIQTTLS